MHGPQQGYFCFRNFKDGVLGRTAPRLLWWDKKKRCFYFLTTNGKWPDQKCLFQFVFNERQNKSTHFCWMRKTMLRSLLFHVCLYFWCTWRQLQRCSVNALILIQMRDAARIGQKKTIYIAQQRTKAQTPFYTQIYPCKVYQNTKRKKTSPMRRVRLQYVLEFCRAQQ